ncbi:uncharacterized protein LOC143007034 [Genypterus blacodes]|uniref:uncharacterized protein LOC143007034 n=1 Tax=Genypterus blacodes TaxID=154954 RepID=UPI003F761D69
MLCYVAFSAHCQCKPGWRLNDDKCYLFSSDIKSWMEANAFCLSQQSNLMSIQDIHERGWLRTQIGEEVFWIGLNDRITEDVWEWTDGTPFIELISYWLQGQPDNYNNEDCGQVLGTHFGQWNDENCDVKRKYICKYINTNPTPHCDLASGWMEYGSNCYKLKADTRKSWGAARSDCVMQGGDLVSVTSAAEEQYVTGTMDPSRIDLWIGLSTLKCNKISCQVEEGNTVFTWSDASSVNYTNWAEDEPAIGEQAGTCSAIIKDAGADFAKWRAHVCRFERPYMCERPLNTLCPAGWMSFNGSCYWTVSNTDLLTTWHEAQIKCSDFGAHLVIINSKEEQFYINGMLPDFYQVDIPDIWIGLSDKDMDGEFRWVDKSSTAAFSNYGPGWPKNTPGIWDCGQIFSGNYAGKWETTNCYKSLGYICEMTGGQNLKPTAAPDSQCDPGYLLYGDFCYRFETEMVKNWDDAQADCFSQQANLVSFHSEEELSFLSAHMPGEAWLGLNDKATEGSYVFNDGTPTPDVLPWAPNQPDNWNRNEDCVQLRGMNHPQPGKLNDDLCTSNKEYICKKAKGQGPPPQPPTSGPGWNDKCGYWMSDAFNDYCYLVNYLSVRTWAEARADCVNQGGDLVSVTDPFEQAFLHAITQQIPTGISLWMGGHDSITEGGWEWMDGKPFRYINWSPGNPDNYDGEDCLSILINGGQWNDDKCEAKRGYICKRRGNTPTPAPPHDGFENVLVCQGSSAVLHCPEESVINIQSAFYGRNSADICPYLDGSAEGSCTVPGVLPAFRKLCDNSPFCFVYAHMDEDPCPKVSKYLQMTYSCEQKVCLHGLGVEDGNITDSQLSASSSLGSFTPSKARLKGNSCWMPSTSATSQWIQVNLGQARKVTGIVIQGCPQNDHWVTKFKIQHSMNGIQWFDTTDVEFFPGATDRNTIDTQLLGTPMSAHFVRIIPLEYNVQPGLRFDVLGCTPDYAITCSDTPDFKSDSDRMTVHCPAGCARARYSVFGTVVYRGDSNICAAAIHAGVVSDEIGGDCTLLKAPGENFYTGSSRNGITSRQSDQSYSMSYTFADGELRCSGPDWYEFGDFCYRPFEVKKTWGDAQAACRTLGAELMSIASMKEQSWLESYLYMATSDVWTGLNDQLISGLYVWSDGHPVTLTYWAPGEPNNHEDFKEDCVKMLLETGRWNDVSCSELNTYMCKKPKAHYPVPPVKPTVYGCPQGWDAYAYACYWMEETARTWSEAKAFCEGEEGFILHIGDIYEQSHFTAALSGQDKTGLWWIGLRAQRIGEGVDYTWDNGLPLTFTHWDREQPDNGDGTCVAMTSGAVGGFWDDKLCSEKFKFVCEKPRPDITPPTTAPPPPTVMGCTDGWTALPYFRNCYRLFHNMAWSQRKSWGAAHEDCLARGANLVSIHNHVEEEFITNYTRNARKWIGLKHNPAEGGYSWSDGTPVSYTNWGPGEPNNHDNREDCVEMMSNANGTHSWWNDLNCDAHMDWVCMIAKDKTPILPPVPPPPVPAPDCGTNPGWRKYNDTCYYYNDTDVVDFHTAMRRCYAEHAHLVSILSRDEQAYVNTMVGTGEVGAAWIGMMVFGLTGGQYMWIDSSPVTYTHWDPGEPNNANGEEQCVQMNRDKGGWNDANCGRTGAGYVCKKFPGNDITSPPPTKPWDGNCPEGWMLFKDKCFIFKGKKDDIKANWTQARQWCRDKEGDLAVIDDQYENDFVSSYLRDLEFPTWIGLSDRLVENEYTWSDGFSPVLYTNWNTNEPNNGGGAEDCVAITHSALSSGKWNDDACHRQYSFVCSMTKSSSIPSPPPTKNPCPEGYISWYKNCYMLVEEAADWDSAQKACAKTGGNLASIDMSYDQAFVSGVVLQGKADAWIGLRRQDDGSYKWSDSWPVLFTQWGPGEPTNIKDEGCVSMHAWPYFHGTWNDTDCNQAKPYVCKISTEIPPPTPAPGTGQCLPRFKPFGQYCYYVYNGKAGFSWPAAQYHCKKYFGDLVSIHSRAELEFIRTLNYTLYHNIWIGLTRDQNFGWGWTDKSSVGFLNWAANEPNEAFHPGDIAEENCVEMYLDGRWNDNNCMQKRGYACRHLQFFGTDGNTISPTVGPGDVGVIVGGIIGTMVIVTLMVGLLYYVFSVRGYKLSSIKLPTKNRTTDRIDVPAFNNPNFADESES